MSSELSPQVAPVGVMQQSLAEVPLKRNPLLWTDLSYVGSSRLDRTVTSLGLSGYCISPSFIRFWSSQGRGSFPAKLALYFTRYY